MVLSGGRILKIIWIHRISADPMYFRADFCETLVELVFILFTLFLFDFLYFDTVLVFVDDNNKKHFSGDNIIMRLLIDNYFNIHDT
jgi:hypothetical protein